MTPKEQLPRPPGTIRIAQISDMHCYRVALSPTQFLSKRWVGNINVLFNRRLKYHKDPNPALIELFDDLDVDHVILSGDLTTTALPSEFQVARDFADRIEARGIQVHAIPGNHDNYTKHSLREKTFYRYFEQETSGHGLSMRNDGVALKPLGPGWWWIGVDTTLPTPLFSAIGRFTKAIETKLEEALDKVPKGDRIVLTNHFPMFSTIHHSHDMRRCDALRALLVRWPNVEVYLHGHVHRQSITDHRSSGLPIILNSGSCGFKRRATFHLIDLSADNLKIYVYAREKRGDQQGNWTLRERAQFS
jgi:3',5'-cyclic AMP phosphodiesterase CpdA